MKTTIGRIVIYKPDEEEKLFMKLKKSCNVSNELPAVIVAVWGEETVNLKVLLDGDGEIWKTSVLMGDNEGTWHWPKREE